MLTISASDIPSLLIENEGLNGFYFITIPSNELRTYRIAMEKGDRSYYYDFNLNTSTLASNIEMWDGLNITDPLDGTVIIGIRFDRSKFSDFEVNPTTPESIVLTQYKTIVQARNDSIGPNTYQGETFKLLLLTPYNPSVNLVEINRDYLTGNSLIIRFVYYRILSNSIVFTGSFGDPMMDNDIALQALRTEIDPIKPFTTINQFGTGSTATRRYFIFKTTATPNIIFSDATVTEATDMSENYTIAGIKYRLTVPGNVIKGLPFQVFLNVLDIGDNIIEPPTNTSDQYDVRAISDVALVPSMTVNYITSTKTLRVILTINQLVNEFNLRLRLETSS